ncbi:glycoside hydrolase family protein [Citrobacter portucalensis]
MIVWKGGSNEACKDVTGVWTVCDGQTWRNIDRHKTYADRKCDALLWKDL